MVSFLYGDTRLQNTKYDCFNQEPFILGLLKENINKWR